MESMYSGNPATPQQMAELEQYLKTDSVITDAEAPNGFGIKIDIRAPLLDALGKWKPQPRAWRFYKEQSIHGNTKFRFGERPEEEPQPELESL
jgi:hypothetical protein